MRCVFRFFVTISALLILPLFLLNRKIADLWDQYNVSAYIRASIAHGDPPTPPIPAETGDKIIVMAKLEQENTDWVAEYLPKFVPFYPRGAFVSSLFRNA